MSENKFTTYLLYAIGEILLVVIGILIAVSIDKWNQNGKDRKKELSYLSSYQNDLHENIKELDRVITKSAKMSSMADSLIDSFTTKGLIQVAQVDSMMYQLIGYTKYLSQDGTTENLLGTGSLEIIQNLTIRSSFVTQEADRKNLRNVEIYLFKAFNEYIDHLKRNTRLYNGQLAKFIVDDTIIALLSRDTYFLNILDDLSATFKEVKGHYVERKNELVTLLEIVEAEIQKVES